MIALRRSKRKQPGDQHYPNKRVRLRDKCSDCFISSGSSFSTKPVSARHSRSSSFFLLYMTLKSAQCVVYDSPRASSATLIARMHVFSLTSSRLFLTGAKRRFMLAALSLTGDGRKAIGRRLYALLFLVFFISHNNEYAVPSAYLSCAKLNKIV